MAAGAIRNYFLTGLLLIGLINLAAANPIPHNEPIAYMVIRPEISPFSSASAGAKSYDDFSGFGKFGLGLLNIPFGIGSYVAGEWRDGLILSFMHSGGIALAVWGVLLFPGNNYSKKGSGSLIISSIVIGAGIGLFGLALIEGFAWPFGSYFAIRPPSVVRKARSANKAGNDTLNMMFVPLPNGKAAGMVKYTMLF